MRRHWFFISSLLVLAAGILLVIFLDDSHIATSLGDALIVAVILAVLVDQYAKQRLLNSLLGRVLVAIPQEPAEFSVAVRNLTSLDQHAVHCRWIADFRWESKETGILEVVLTAWVAVKNSGAKNYSPPRESWVFESVQPYKTSLDHIRYEVPERGLRRALDWRQLDKGVTRGGHLVRINTAELASVQDQGFECGPGEVFTLEKQATMYRLSSDFLPLANRWIVLSTELECCGPAVGDLDLNVLCSGQDPDVIDGVKEDGSSDTSQPLLPLPESNVLRRDHPAGMVAC